MRTTLTDVAFLCYFIAKESNEFLFVLYCAMELSLSFSIHLFESKREDRMKQPPEFSVTGSLPSANKAGPDKIPETPGAVPAGSPGRLMFAPTSSRTPVVIPPDKKRPASAVRPLSEKLPVPPGLKRPRAFQKLDRRWTWYVVATVGIVSLVLGFVFAVPLNNGQQGSSTLAQGIGNLITNGQNGNVTSQSHGQGQGQGQGQPPAPGSGQFTPGYSTVPGGGYRLFSSSSPWNVPIGSNVQLDPNSGGIASELAGCCHVPAMFSYGMPIYTSTASDPLYTVQDSDSTFQSYQPFHIPDAAAPSPGSDKWLFIYDQTKNLIFEMWEANKSGGTWSASAAEVYSPTGDGVLQPDGAPQGGNGASYFGGVVTAADIKRGYINHALSLTSQYTSSDWRYPMHRSDGHSGNIPMGARLQLDPAVNCATLPGASVGEKMVCQALQTYGGYMRDTSGVALSIYFEGEDLGDPNRNPPNGSPGDPGRSGGVFGNVGLHDSSDLGAIPWGRLRVLQSWNSFTALNATTGSAGPLAATISPAWGPRETRPALVGEPADTRRRLRA